MMTDLNSPDRADMVAQLTACLLELSKADPENLKEAFQMVTEKVSTAIAVERVSIWAHNAENKQLQCEDLYMAGSQRHLPGNILFQDNFPKYFHALENSRFIHATEARNDPRTAEFLEIYLLPTGIESMLDIPFRYEGKLAGVFCCETLNRKKTWLKEEIEFSISVCEILTNYIHNDLRRKAEKALIVSEEKYRKIVDNALVAIYHTDLQGNFHFVNQAMLELFEFDSVDEAMTCSVEDLYPAAGQRAEFLEILLKNKIIKNFELTLVTRKGNPRMVLLNAFLESETINGMLMDITERKKDEEEIKAARERAEESDRLKTSLLANMSHEFRTPMNAILGFSDLITHESNDPDILLFAQKIHTSGQRLMTTLKSILDLADLEATRSKIRIQDLNLSDTVRKMLNPVYSKAREKGLDLLTDLPPGIITKADESLLLGILNNLLDNAIKFTHNGSVRIETDVYHGNPSWAVVRIKDTGIGIPRNRFDFIFEEFRQLSEGYNRSFEGTGLGLTLAKKMAKLLNGKITLESEIGIGSVFTLWLPESGNQHLTDLPSVFTSNENTARREFKLKPREELTRLLIVEDNDDNAEIIKLYLRGFYKTERAPDAKSAINMVKNYQFSGILMDINLGFGLDGLNATQEIRKLNNYSKTPIIAITGYTMAGDREKLLEGGCSHYLGKPFSQQGLLDLLSEIFD